MSIVRWQCLAINGQLIFENVYVVRGFALCNLEFRFLDILGYQKIVAFLL